MALPAGLERFATHSGDAVSELILNASLGQIPGVSTMYIFGHNPNIPAGTTGMLWPLDNAFSATGLYQANAVTVYVSSTNAADVGMTLKLTVIDSSWNMQYIGVTLNGQTPVALPIQVRRVLMIENVGSTRFAGDVYAGTSATPTLGAQLIGNTLNFAYAEDQISHTAWFTVPLGKTLFIYEFSGGTPTNDSVSVSGYFSNPGTNVFKSGSHLPAYRGYQRQGVSFYKLVEKTDIYLAAKAYTNNAEATGHLLGILVDNKYVKS